MFDQILQYDKHNKIRKFIAKQTELNFFFSYSNTWVHEYLIYG